MLRRDEIDGANIFTQPWRALISLRAAERSPGTAEGHMHLSRWRLRRSTAVVHNKACTSHASGSGPASCTAIPEKRVTKQMVSHVGMRLDAGAAVT